MTRNTERDRRTREYYGLERVAEAYEQLRYGSPTGQARDALQKHAVLSLVDSVDVVGKVVLDAGCGTGRFARALVQAGAQKVVGIDSSSSMLKVARCSDHNTNYVKGDILSMPFPNDAFDLVVCVDTINHIASYAAAVAELCRVARKVVVSTPNRNSALLIGYVYKVLKRVPLDRGAIYANGFDKMGRAYSKYFTAQELIKMLSRNGMRGIQSAGCILVPSLPGFLAGLFEWVDVVGSLVVRRFGTCIAVAGEKA